MLESARYKLARSLWKVLLYIWGEEQASYPNNKACILWDLIEQIPKIIRVKLSKNIDIWQPITLKNVPFMCYHCNKPENFARACPAKFPPDKEEEYEDNPPVP